MLPLYYARMASFSDRTKDMTTKEAEEVIDLQARTFEKLNPSVEDLGQGVTRTGGIFS